MSETHRLASRLLGLALLLLLPLPCRAETRTELPAKYREAVQALEKFIAHEVEQKGLPALSIAVVEDQKIVWARGFGFADPAAKKAATADTVYRVGSVSKLFTDLAIMQLVEQGKLDLDAPVTRYLPDFKPENPYRKQITLRQLMTHRSGLVRESPVGHYFDDTNPSLADTVRSLNRTKLVYEPETRIKYSNAAIATVGYVLETTQKEAFTKYLQRRLLKTLGMQHSSFEPSEEVKRNLAKGIMWSYQGRTFPAPTFQLGMAPAGSMYSTVNDLGRFLSFLFAGGRGVNGQVVKEETLKKMWQVQFPKKKDEKTGFGLGFMLDELDGKASIGHGGAIYGFATELLAVPSEKIGAVVIISKDVANGTANRIAEEAIRQFLAARAGKPLPKLETTEPVGVEQARKLAGRYEAKGGKALDLLERDGKLWALPSVGGLRVELRRRGGDLVMDDCLGYGKVIHPKEAGKLEYGKDVFTRVEVKQPAALPAKWKGLIGEYGWDHDVLYILERDGKLQALIEWVFLYPLTEESENVYAFPKDAGLYHGEKLVFQREGQGRATGVVAASVLFRRRKIDGENGETFRIRPVKPLKGLREAALAAKPPREKGDFRKPDLVDLTTLDKGIKLDIRYATTNNFLSTPMYTSAKAYMQKPAAEALVRVHKALGKQGYGLLIHDAYRPWYVTKMFWDATPEKWHLFVANPDDGSRHNRGCAVDLTLYDLKTGKPIEMVGGYDEFSDRSYPDYLGGTSRQRWHRELLRRAMQAEGFTVYEAEWWHFDFKDWRKYPILNQTFEEIEKGKKG